MTIASGVMCGDGLLLAADTKYSGGDQTILGTKLFVDIFSFGSVALTFAGHKAFGQSTIQKILHVLKVKEKKVLTGADAADVIGKVLAKEYKAHVYNHPDRATGNFEYNIIFGIWTPADGNPAMYTSLDTAVTPSDSGFESVGTGAALFRYLVRSASFDKQQTIEDALLPVVSAIGRVKDYVPDVGGNTEVIAILNNGELTKAKRFDVSLIDKHATKFDERCQFLFRALANVSVSDAEWKAILANFSSEISKLRGEWMGDETIQEIWENALTK
jgi:hypothetical protein